jgi:cyclophilin family peptidyl-prolyl cis-trans isomerase
MHRLLAAGLLALTTTAAFVALSAHDLQQGTLSREEIALAADRIRADRWYDDVTRLGASQAVRQNRSADMDLLLLALKQPFPELRAAAVRELGRFELAANAAFIASFLGDPVDLVQREAADALVQTLWDKKEAEAAPAVEILDRHILQERSAGMLTAFWTAISELPLDAQTAQKYEARFINEIRQATPLTFGAQAALLTLTRHRRGRPLMAGTEKYVMELARKGLDQGDPTVMVGLTSYGSTIGYIEILQAAQADADDIAFDAATFVCRKPESGCGSDIRRLGVDLLNPANPAHQPVLLTVARDRSDIRAAAAAIRKLIKSPGVTLCQLLDLAQKTPAEPDVITALADDSTDRKGECGDWSPESWLTQQASTLISATRGTDWIAPAAALEALARRAPEAARPIASDVGAGHVQWPVRVAAARVAATLKDAPLAMRLAADEHQNVRTAALDALLAIESPALWPAAVEALSSPDYQLVRMAVMVLKGAPEPIAVLPSLFDALRRLSEEARDTSRRARLALLDRIGELSPGGAPDSPDRAAVLNSHLRDYDPLVAKAAAALLQKSSTSPVEAQPKYRPAFQPAAERLRTLPPCVLVSLEGEESITILLNRNEAPVAVARFLESAESGYYANSMFYRDDENLTVFGNRAANDEGGWTRFARDEPGTRVRWMSVTMLNHGPDTADGRLAIRWRGNPELDRRETVIGQAHAPPSALRAIELGKLVEKIVVGGEGRVAAAGPRDPCNPRRPW